MLAEKHRAEIHLARGPAFEIGEAVTELEIIFAEQENLSLARQLELKRHQLDDLPEILKMLILHMETETGTEHELLGASAAHL